MNCVQQPTEVVIITMADKKLSMKSIKLLTGEVTASYVVKSGPTHAA